MGRMNIMAMIICLVSNTAIGRIFAENELSLWGLYIIAVGSMIFMSIGYLHGLK